MRYQDEHDQGGPLGPTGGQHRKDPGHDPDQDETTASGGERSKGGSNYGDWHPKQDPATNQNDWGAGRERGIAGSNDGATGGKPDSVVVPERAPDRGADSRVHNDVRSAGRTDVKAVVATDTQPDSHSGASTTTSK